MVRSIIRKRKIFRRKRMYRRPRRVTNRNVARVVARMGPIRRPEVKNTYRQGTYNIGALAYSNSHVVGTGNRIPLGMWETVQGTAQDERVGSRIYGKYFTLRILVKMRASSTNLSMKVRIILVANKNTDVDVGVSLPSFWKYADVDNWLHKIVANDYKVYHDSILHFNQNQLTNASTGTTQVLKTISKKYNKIIEYDRNATKPNKSVNQLWLVVLPETNVDGNSPSLSNVIKLTIMENAYFTDP